MCVQLASLSTWNLISCGVLQNRSPTLPSHPVILDLHSSVHANWLPILLKLVIPQTILTRGKSIQCKLPSDFKRTMVKCVKSEQLLQWKWYWENNGEQWWKSESDIERTRLSYKMKMPERQSLRIVGGGEKLGMINPQKPSIILHYVGNQISANLFWTQWKIWIEARLRDSLWGSPKITLISLSGNPI